MALRIAVVTDIHYGPTKPTETKLGLGALQLFDETVGEIAAYSPDLLVELGDRLSDDSPEADAERLAELAERFARLPGRREHLQGNHDIVNLSETTTSRLLGRPLGHRSHDAQGWHLVFWEASPEYRGGLRLSGEDLEWLERDLNATSLPTVIFSHVPLGGGSMVGNYYFEGRSEGRAGHVNAELAREVIEASGKVVLAVAGHVHWNSLHTVDGTHYVTVQSLSETFTTAPQAAAAWATIELGDTLHLSVLGNDPFEVSLTPKRLGSHWLPPRTRATSKRVGHAGATGSEGAGSDR